MFVQCVMLNNKLVAKVRTILGKIGRRVGKTKTQKSNSELVNCSFSTSAGACCIILPLNLKKLRDLCDFN